ncbi:hypothetical protein [Luteimonas abyssi]|uniref:hypothetical protein n=1 Tax=Luteimonas abyssi TaxID=1247514 RepID=UPI000737BD60|nr:hypothetical protein [Luteimonas abyssi]
MMPTVSLVAGVLSAVMLCLTLLGMGSVFSAEMLAVVAVVTGILDRKRPRAQAGLVLGVLVLLLLLVMFAAATSLIGTGGDWSRWDSSSEDVWLGRTFERVV